MSQTIISQANLGTACDVFVLSEGAHRYRDALALGVFLQNLSNECDVQVWPVLCTSEGGDKHRYALASEQRTRLTAPVDTTRSAAVIGRVELFGPDMDVDLVQNLRPALPTHMDDTPSTDPAYRELRLICGRLKIFRTIARTRGGHPPFYDYAAVYCGWQTLGRARRRIVIMEGISALGTIAAAKAFCSPSCFPAALSSVEGFFLVYGVDIRLQAKGRGKSERLLIKEDRQKAVAILPWRLDDVEVGQLKCWQAVAPVQRKSASEFWFLGAPLRHCRQIDRDRLRVAVLDALVTHAGDWIEGTDVIQSIPLPQIRGGLRQALTQVLEGLVSQGLVIEQHGSRFRHISTLS